MSKVPNITPYTLPSRNTETKQKIATLITRGRTLATKTKNLTNHLSIWLECGATPLHKSLILLHSLQNKVPSSHRLGLVRTWKNLRACIQVLRPQRLPHYTKDVIHVPVRTLIWHWTHRHHNIHLCQLAQLWHGPLMKITQKWTDKKSAKNQEKQRVQE